MSIASEITRLQGVKADILTAIGNKGVTVPSGSALDDCPSLIASIGEGVIGGKRYKTVVMPDGKEWLAENLDFKFCNIGGSGTPTTANAWYYNNDESTYGWNGYKCGLLYNWHAVKLLNDNRSELIPGWHVPTKDEWDTLATACGGASTAGTKLKALDNSTGTGFPSSWGGTDNYGFKYLPSGGYASLFAGIDEYSYAWSITESGNKVYRYLFENNSSAINIDTGDKAIGIPIRLVRDT